MTINVQFNNASVLDALTQLSLRINDLSPAMRQIAGVLADETEEAFAQERSPEGLDWEGLADSTIEQREKNNSWPGSLLQVSGMLAKAIHTEYTNNSASIGIGSEIPYAPLHQFGGFAGKGKKVFVPARPFLGVSEQGKENLLEILANHINID